MKNLKSIFLRLIIILGLAAIIFIAYSVYEETKKKKAVQEEINKLQEEAEKISQENLNISQKISYLESQEYKEREAKEKLNLKSPDENVIVIKPSPSQKEENALEEDTKESGRKAEQKEETSNPKKWWNYFFDYKL